jgi:ABC-type sugar transport system permease subunit
MNLPGNQISKPSSPRKSARFSLNNRRWLGLFLIIPSLVAIFGIILVPFVNSLVLSLLRRDLSRPQMDAFIGLQNYLNLLQDPRYLNSFQVTLIFSLLSVLLEVVLGVSFALVLNQHFKGQGFVRGLMILPWAMPAIVNAAMWKWIYNADYGALNALLTQLRLIDAYQVWLADPTKAMALIILANIWKETPFTTILVLAALQGIPTDLNEAATMDGASAWQRFFNITLRLLLPVILVAGLLQFIWGFQTFELAYIITGGGPFSSTELVSLRVYAITFRSLRFGYGAALAYLTAMILLVPAIFYIRAAYRSIIEY